jgi:aldose 1-epimerase
MERRVFGKTADGSTAYLYKLENKNGSYIEVSDFGAIFRSWVTPDRNGKSDDIVLGHETLESVREKGGWNGATIGRVINRIANGELWIDTDVVVLETQWENMTFHGGKDSYANQLFAADCYVSEAGETVELYHKDKNDSGFPGWMDVWTTFTLTDENEVIIRYKALPTKDTVINIGNHVYFNIGGHGSGTVSEQLLQVEADFYLPSDKNGMATGEIYKVDGTPFDLRSPKRIGDGLESDDPQILLQNGYDHNFCVRHAGYRRAAKLYDPKSGRVLTTYTDLPGVHVYTGNNDPEGSGYKGGATYARNSGICFETQYYPNSPANSQFPSAVFRAGEIYRSETRFSVTVE